MFPNTHQHLYKAEPNVSLLQPLLIYSPQPQFFNLPALFPYHFQSSYQNNQLNLNNSLPYFTKEIPNVAGYKQNLPLALPQEETGNKNVLNEPRKPRSYLQNDSVQKIKKSRNNCNSRFVLVDISHIKSLPPQEKLSLEQLRKPKRKFKLWTKEEDKLLLKLKENPDLNWREIASKFPTRTLNACQYRINRLKNPKSIKTVKEKTLNLTI